MASKEEFWEALRDEWSYRKQVNDWMSEQGKLGNLRRNDDAPMWGQYEQSWRRRDKIMAAIAEELIK